MFQHSIEREMEFSILEELMTPRIENWAIFPIEPNEVSPNVWSFSSSHQTPELEMSYPSLLEQFSHRYPFSEPQTLLDNFAVPKYCSSYNYQDENPVPIQEDYTVNLENEDFGPLDNASLNGFEQETSRFKVETLEAPKNIDKSNVGFSTERKSKSKKADGLPSKNLMAERRRRKRLNDCLSMLRSIVPKISKVIFGVLAMVFAGSPSHHTNLGHYRVPLIMVMLWAPFLPCHAYKNIFILAGQSNMSGRGGVINGSWTGYIPPEYRSQPSVLRLSAGLRWEEAFEPLHRDIDNETCGVGPGMAFANYVLEKDSNIWVIGLIPCAVGGTSILRWRRGSDLYDKLVKRSQASLEDGGAIRALLWYQGESDTREEEAAESYKKNLEDFIVPFRTDLSILNLPIIQVQLHQA